MQNEENLKNKTKQRLKEERTTADCNGTDYRAKLKEQTQRNKCKMKRSESKTTRMETQRNASNPKINAARMRNET